MCDYVKRFKSCGENVRIGRIVQIEHPERMEVGNNVTFMHDVDIFGAPEFCRIGSNVTFYPYCYVLGSPERFVIGDNVYFSPTTFISLGSGPGSCVEVGHHSHFAPGCALYGAGGLRLGPYCNIAAHVVLATIGHDPDAVGRPMACAPAKTGPITLVEDVWVGANATIFANTTVAKGCIIGAGAVLTKDTEPFGVYVGVPARRLRDRPRPMPPSGEGTTG